MSSRPRCSIRSPSARRPRSAAPGATAVRATGSGGGDVYLVSVRGGRGRVVDLRERAPSLSAAVDFYELMTSSAEWLPFIGDSDAIVAAAARMIDAAP